jgi:hypothetical protein
MASNQNKSAQRKIPSTTWIVRSIGTVLLIVAAVVAWDEYNFIRIASRADGVVAMQNSGRQYEIRFKAADGRIVQYEENSDVSYEVGESVTVLYDPKAPENHPKTTDFASAWGRTIYLALFGIVAFAVSFFPLSRSESE